MMLALALLTQLFVASTMARVAHTLQGEELPRRGPS